jgi:peptide/nickel transport system permease protein
MWIYLVKRILLLFLILIIAATILFLFVHLIPGDPVVSVLGEQSSRQDVQRIRQHLQLDRPLLGQYIDFILDRLSLRFGHSLLHNRPVRDVIFEALPNTFYLALLVMFLSLSIGFPLGVVAAFKENTIVDSAITFVSSIGIAIPNFFLGPLLIILFSIKLNWLPVSGAGGFLYMILPALTLSTSMLALLTHIIKTSVSAELTKPYILFARAKGFNGWKLFKNHVFRNSLAPIITTIGLQFGALLSGTVITETVFSMPGIGYLLVTAVRQRDYPMVQAIVILVTGFYLLLSFLVDISYLAIDPRLRQAVQKGIK